MASMQSSQDSRRSCDRHPLAWRTPQSRHRAKSRQLFDRQRPNKGAAHGRYHCQEVSYDHGAVRIFSRSSEEWVNGEIVSFAKGNLVRVEYKIGGYLYGKTMGLHSEHLKIPTRSQMSTHAASIELEWTDRSRQMSIRPTTQQAEPLMQGCRESLPIVPEKYYQGMSYILEMLKRGDVVLLKGSWLLRRCWAGEALPRRQELPSEAVWDYAEFKSAFVKWSWIHSGTGFACNESGFPQCFRRDLPCDALWDSDDDVDGHDDDEETGAILWHVECVSISHCWYTKDHPDPEGLQLLQIRPALEAKLEHLKRRDGADADLAIFWCWCSFYQEPRSETEQVGFERSMQHMDLWYINSNFQVWMLTEVPANVANTTPYDDRGWTTWERIVATMQSDIGCNIPRELLDLGVWEHGCQLSWGDVEVGSRVANGPPLDPETFAELIHKKHFTKGKADLERVIENYRRNFIEVMSVTEIVVYKDARHLDVNNMLQLCRNLYFCRRLSMVRLENFRFSYEGIVALSEFIQQSDTLTNLCLWYAGSHHCAFPGLMQAIARSQVRILKLQKFKLLGDEGIPALSCAALTHLTLFDCKLDSAGVMALATAIGACKLEFVWLDYANRLSTFVIWRLYIQCRRHGKVMMCHGGPCMPSPYKYPGVPEDKYPELHHKETLECVLRGPSPRLMRLMAATFSALVPRDRSGRGARAAN